MTDLEIYYENTQKPWGKLFYKIIWEQLSFSKSMKILDFGSGFSITANHMALENEVIAIEPNIEMCAMRLKENQYTHINGDIKSLYEFGNNSFDLIICHNVFEYLDNKDYHINEFSRILKVGGKLSLVKHNHLGRIMQKVVYDNDIALGTKLLNGEPAIAQNFGEIKYYNLSDIDKWTRMYGYKQIDNFGVRTFFALNPDNTIRYKENWIQSMFELELKVSKIEEFRNIAFFNHVILEKL